MFVELALCTEKNNRFFHLNYFTGTLLQSSFSVMNCCPRIWYIKKEGISMYFQTFMGETLRNDIAPFRSYLGYFEILEEFFSYLCALLIELECIKMSLLSNRFGNSTRKWTWACSGFNYHRSSIQLKFEYDCGVVHRIKNLSFSCKSLSNQCGFGFYCYHFLLHFIKSLYLLGPRLIYKTQMTKCSSIWCLNLVSCNQLYKFWVDCGFEKHCIWVIGNFLLLNLRRILIHFS